MSLEIIRSFDSCSNHGNKSFHSTVEETFDAVSDVGRRFFSTSPFYLLKNPRLQTLGGLAALGYGVYQINSAEFLSRVGLSIGGIILYHARLK